MDLLDKIIGYVEDALGPVDVRLTRFGAPSIDCYKIEVITNDDDRRASRHVSSTEHIDVPLLDEMIEEIENGVEVLFQNASGV